MDEDRKRRWGPPGGEPGRAPAETPRQTLAVALAAFAAFLVAVAAIAAAVVVPGYLRARAAADEAAAANQLRAFASAEETFATLNGRYGAIPDLAGANLVDPAWTNSRERHGYRFSVEVTRGGEGFAIRAIPLPDSRNERHFFVDETLELRYADGSEAGPGSAVYGPAEARGDR